MNLLKVDGIHVNMPESCAQLRSTMIAKIIIINKLILYIHAFIMKMNESAAITLFKINYKVVEF